MSSSHYIRTIHTSFTAAHPSPWARTAPLPLHMHAQHPPLYTTSNQGKHATLNSLAQAPQPPASGAGGRRRAYAFRAPSPPQSRPKFDPFADEPTSPVPSIAHLASLSTPPTPRLAAAALPPPHRQGGVYAQQRRNAQQQQQQHVQYHQQQGFYGGYYGGAHGPTHQQPRRSGFPGQRSRTPGPQFVLDARTAISNSGPTEVWRSTSPGPNRRVQGFEFEEYDDGMGRGGNGGLMMEPTSRRVAPPPPPMQVRVSAGPAMRRSPPPPQVRTPSPPQPTVSRTPSPPTAKTPAQIQAEKDAKARLVAGILLNRIHVGRPRRRVPSPVGGRKVYVPSGLSREVCVA